MYCQNCGKELSNDVVFCPSCGTKINNYFDNVVIEENKNKTEESVEENITPTKNKKKMKKRTKILIAISCIIILFLAIVANTDEKTLDQLENADFDNDRSEQTTVAVFFDDANLTVEEKIEILKNSKDINEIIDYFSVCPDANKPELLEIFKKVFLTFLTENRSKIYSHNISFIEDVSNILSKVDISSLPDGEEILLVVDKINEIYSGAGDYIKHSEANELVRNCIEVDGEIIKRIGDAANEGKYLDEYLFEYYGLYDDWAELIIYSEESLQPGNFFGYLKYKDTKEYTSDGFEYSFDVYTIMTDREIEKYLKAEDVAFELADIAYDVDVCFDELCELVDNYAKKYPALINDENYVADYVGGYKELPYEYLHKLSLKSDNTFDISINMYEGFAEYSGTFKKEGNLIICENNDIYFELVISGETLVYHNTMEYSTVYMDDGTLFIR